MKGGISRFSGLWSTDHGAYWSSCWENRFQSRTRTQMPLRARQPLESSSQATWSSQPSWSAFLFPVPWRQKDKRYFTSFNTDVKVPQYKQDDKQQLSWALCCGDKWGGPRRTVECWENACIKCGCNSEWLNHVPWECRSTVHRYSNRR